MSKSLDFGNQHNSNTKPRGSAPHINMTITKKRAGLTGLFNAFEAAHKEKGIEPPTKPLSRRQWLKADDTKSIDWFHPEFGSIRIIPDGINLTQAGSEAGASWARLNYTGQPRNVFLSFEVKLTEGVALFQCRFDEGGSSIVAQKAQDQTDRLSTPIDWIDPQNGNRSSAANAVPSTRKKGCDDVAFIIIDSKGRFVQIEVSVRTLRGVLWIAVQEIYMGQVVTTTHQKAAGISLKHHKDVSRVAFVAPLLPEGAYPGIDYIKSFGSDVVIAALSLGAFSQFSEVSASEWTDPGLDIPEELKRKGYQRAVVSFFNISWNGGSGFALLADGRSCFVHAGQIMNEAGQPVMSQGEFPFLYGREVIAVKVKEEDGRLKATAIRKESAV